MKESWEGPDGVLIDDVEKQRLDEASASEGALPEPAAPDPNGRAPCPMRPRYALASWTPRNPRPANRLTEYLKYINFSYINYY
jgi:hypothetical protein